LKPIKLENDIVRLYKTYTSTLFDELYFL